MARAIFQKDFNYTSRKRNAGWSVKASDKPQSFPEELIAAAVSRGVATRVPPKARDRDDAHIQPLGKAETGAA